MRKNVCVLTDLSVQLTPGTTLLPVYLIWYNRKYRRDKQTNITPKIKITKERNRTVLQWNKGLI